MIFKKKQKEVDMKKCEKAREELQAVLNNNKLNLRELVWTYGQLGYDIGASLEGEAYDLEAVEQKYFENPTVGVAFMIQGLTIQTWMTKELKDVKKANTRTTKPNGRKPS